MFWTVARNEDEGRRDFIERVWRIVCPDLPENIREVSPLRFAATVVKEGYESPYTFGKTLRTMVHDNWAEVYSGYRLEGNLAHTVYYAYFISCGEPLSASFYDPQGEKTLGNP